MNPQKVILILPLLMASLAVYSQAITITKRDGSLFNTKITAISNKDLYTPNGTLSFKDLASVAFESKQQKDQTTYDRLEAAGVQVIFTGVAIVPGEPATAAPQSGVAKSVEQQDLTELRESLRKYQKAHQAGTGLQLLGMALTVAGSALYMSDSSGNKDLAQGLTIGGGALFVVGLGVELSVGGVKF